MQCLQADRGDDMATITTTVTDLRGADVEARRLDGGDVVLVARDERGTEVRLVGTRMTLLKLLDSMREAVVLLDDAEADR